MTDTNRTELAAAFGRDIDPLAAFEDVFAREPVASMDLFEMFVADVLEPKDPAPRTLTNYDRAFRHWRDHMAEEGRHYALPSEEHVTRFIEKELSKGNSPATVKQKLSRLGSAFRYWQEDQLFPHSTDYNPIKSALSKFAFENGPDKEPPEVPLDRLREIIAGVLDVRDRAIIVTQLKLGLRATEVTNIEIADLDIRNAALREHYTDMGSNPGLDDHENAIYIPHDREGNKSQRPRLLPLDAETRTVLTEWLLIRPDEVFLDGEDGEDVPDGYEAGDPRPWVFLSDSRHTQMDRDGINEVWKAAFPRDDYGETPRHRAVTSHFGRHYFSTWWRMRENVPKELVQYMRGDIINSAGPFNSRDAIDSYLHAYYSDIEETYREGIYRLRVRGGR